MRFKNFYLAEKIYEKNIKELKDVFSGIIEKEIPNEVKTDKGVEITIPSVGAWSNVKEKITQAMLDKKYKDFSKDSNKLNFKNKEYSVFINYENSNINIFVTDDLKYNPEENSEEESENEV